MEAFEIYGELKRAIQRRTLITYLVTSGDYREIFFYLVLPFALLLNAYYLISHWLHFKDTLLVAYDLGHIFILVLALGIHHFTHDIVKAALTYRALSVLGFLIASLQFPWFASERAIWLSSAVIVSVLLLGPGLGGALSALKMAIAIPLVIQSVSVLHIMPERGAYWLAMELGVWSFITYMFFACSIIAINYLRRNLDAALFRKTQYLRILMHDISTPLNILSGTVEHLSMKAHPQAEAGFARAQRASDSIRDIIENVRRLDQVEVGGGAPSVPGRVTIEKMLDDVEEHFGQRAKKKGVELHLNMDARLQGSPMLTDPVLLTFQILGNLVGNAIKFTPAGGEVNVSLTTEGEDLCIIVEDNGIGMSVAQLKKLRSPRGPEVRTSDGGETGNGYGFQIAQFCVDQLGGTLDISSRNHSGADGKTGTRVEVKIPTRLYRLE